MDNVYLSGTVLFQGASPEETGRMLGCLGAVEKPCEKGQVIFHAGDVARNMGIVITGGVNIENDDLWGNKNILSHIRPGQIFAEAYACIPDEPMMVSAVASEPSKILLLDAGRILKPCPSACPCHARLISNLLAATAQKNLSLSRRMMHTSPKSIRGRVLSYLGYLAARQDSSVVEVPFNRQQLADYLSVDRSALSSELGKMQRDGLIKVQKNRFTLEGGNGRQESFV